MSLFAAASEDLLPNYSQNIFVRSVEGLKPQSTFFRPTVCLSVRIGSEGKSPGVRHKVRGKPPNGDEQQ